MEWIGIVGLLIIDTFIIRYDYKQNKKQEYVHTNISR